MSQPGGACQRKTVLRAVLCTLALGVDTTGAFHSPGRLTTGWRAVELKGMSDLYGPPAETGPEVCLAPPQQCSEIRATHTERREKLINTRARPLLVLPQNPLPIAPTLLPPSNPPHPHHPHRMRSMPRRSSKLRASQSTLRAILQRRRRRRQRRE